MPHQSKVGVAADAAFWGGAVEEVEFWRGAAAEADLWGGAAPEAELWGMAAAEAGAGAGLSEDGLRPQSREVNILTS